MLRIPQTLTLTGIVSKFKGLNFFYLHAQHINVILKQKQIIIIIIIITYMLCSTPYGVMSIVCVPLVDCMSDPCFTSWPAPVLNNILDLKKSYVKSMTNI